MNTNQSFIDYTLFLADSCLVLSQKNAEWCAHGPILEQDIAITNIALDLIGQARSLLEHAGNLEEKGRSEDDLAFLRDAWDFRNVLLVEQPNQDWAFTIIRQFLFDAFHYPLLQQLTESKDEHLAAIAQKSIKEVAYHLRYSSEWMIRLGDGTEVSHQKMQTALDELWMFSGESTTADEVDLMVTEAGIGANLELVQQAYAEKVNAILHEATLQKPAGDWMQRGGKTGTHSEYLGFILAEMQFMQRAYPGQKW